MAQDFKRTDRIADQMQRDLAELLRSSMKDPRVGMVTVNQVVVAKDLGFADVYVTLLTVDDLDADAAEVKSTIKVLNGAAGFLRSELGRMIKLRTIPQLRFHFDASVKRGRQLDNLISQARNKDADLSVDEGNEDSNTPTDNEG
ncbi:ribosome-binding factor A [Oleiphilus sp. HI0081]|uniref:30S ribosome-binding factor RbfA n=1 Tax=unclassified Oleiphilus TaxID=2631174 RepID=UPI0007C3B74B|nr:MULTISPECIES: 30S ribosome-binding factor RbfA [unclassified Oleiphilus]KZY76887.1 ribosome-binding factor A [Oleiphilus sp. HI0068]KZY77000.1 ribosome-binding factor A [Oleiphilus sp. HI0069]KZY87061.1 ribosome-binding factor A [Oleiphilus sp. HI0072]KZZ16062.1 ribosome-binding factor A [Oleiphilus sp. HI0078]KZZ22115.1 ribosome-binding factor A [Oleiphilus sp. HI0081]KZZ43259.1 ribosome-binding factor A [Oleiphilus sp. HI0085]